MSDPYLFGWPDALVDIHFPRGGLPGNSSEPWYYYITRQTPKYFQYLSPSFGHGWQSDHFLPVIKILPIDTQPLVPTTEVGFGSLEEAIAATNAGAPISQDAWGRFNFKDAFFWKVMGLKPPGWADFSNGLPKNKPGDANHRAINLYIGETVKKWRTNWQAEATGFNAMTDAVDGLGSYGQYGAGPFALPVPGLGVRTAHLPDIQATAGEWYFGATNPYILFQRGYAAFWKQPFAFKYEIAQLSSSKWDMNVFPPRDTTLGPFEPGSTTKPPSSISGKFNGYGQISFPLTSPIIN